MRFRGYTVTTPPYFEPVSLFELKESLKLCTTDTDEDNLLMGLIASARDFVEKYQRRAIVEQTLQMKLDTLCTPMLPVMPNLKSVSSITYLDTAGDSQTLSTDLYDVDTASVPGRITKAYAQTYPTTYPVESAATINYVAGYPKYTGAFVSTTTTSLVATFTDALPPRGVVYVINATGQYEAIGYRAAFNNSGTWTMTMPVALTYTYAIDDVVEVHAIPESTRQAIIAVATQMYEHPAMYSEISLSDNKTARMLLNAERVHEYY